MDIPRDGLRHNELAIEDYVKNNLGFKIDEDEDLCRYFISGKPCPLGAECPKKHVQPAPLNLKKPTGIGYTQAKTICKHWLRGLCKKGDQCEFMHEYHLRKMPECWVYTKFGVCPNGDECMYLHVSEDMRVQECPWYRRGFCPAGPRCPMRHLQKALCPFYIAGFCPYGRGCSMGHASFDPPHEAPLSSTMVPMADGPLSYPEASFRLHNADWLEFAGDQKLQTASAAQQALQFQNPMVMQAAEAAAQHKGETGYA